MRPQGPGLQIVSGLGFFNLRTYIPAVVHLNKHLIKEFPDRKPRSP